MTVDITMIVVMQGKFCETCHYNDQIEISCLRDCLISNFSQYNVRMKLTQLILFLVIRRLLLHGVNQFTRRVNFKFASGWSCVLLLSLSLLAATDMRFVTRETRS